MYNPFSSPEFVYLTKQFRFEGRFIEAVPFGNGHIHDTYAACFTNGNSGVHRYILQRINTNVFREPLKVMENIEKVTAHLRQRILAEGGNPDRETLTLVPTIDNRSTYIDETGGTWRAMVFIEGAQTYQAVTNLDLFTHAAHAFGRFQKHLADFPANELHITLPNFHNTPWRLQNFIQAMEDNAVGRLKTIRTETAFLMRRTNQAGNLLELEKQGRIPLRVTHNDTKLDNVMIDDLTGKGICVIDLDTVMPGSALYDFGDAVRSAANTGAEDEPDLSKVQFDLNVFERFVEGYLSEVGDTLTKDELDNLAFSAWLIAYELALRFLGDYLNGDIYFRINRPNQNLDRARTQIKLLQDIETSYARMENLIQRSG